MPSVQPIIARFQSRGHVSGTRLCAATRDLLFDPVSCQLHPRKRGILAADARRYTPMQCAGLKTVDYSLDLDSGLPEIQQQA